MVNYQYKNHWQSRVNSTDHFVMTITPTLTLEVKTADRAGNMALTHDLVFVEGFLVLKILVADLAIVMILHLVLA